jgi:hypothetical protein
MKHHGGANMSKTRVHVPMTDETRIQLQSLADAQRSSLAAVCADLLEQTAPIAAETAAALVQAREAPARAMRAMNTLLDKQLAEVDQYKLDLTPKATRRKKKTG